MTFVRLYLLAVGAVSVLAGLAYLIRPEAMAAVTALTLSSPTAIIDVQGFYGGQLVGVGLAVLMGLRNGRFVVPALVMAAVPLAGTAAGRLYGVAAAASFPPPMIGLMVLEAATAAVGFALLRRELAHAA